MGRQNNRRKKGTARKAASKRYHRSDQGGKQNINALMNDETMLEILDDQACTEEVLPPQPAKPVVPTIIIIPAEGFSAETKQEQMYVNKVEQYCNAHLSTRAEFLVFNHDPNNQDIAGSTDSAILTIFQEYDFTQAEIHAQGALGAYVAYRMLCLAPERIQRVFFIGGAPSETMTDQAKAFCQKKVKLWYWLHQHGLAKLCAHLAPPHDTSGIMNSSSEFMQNHPESFLQQVLFISSWMPDPVWRVEDGQAYFIPSSKAYDYVGAVSGWYQHNVRIARAPSNSGSDPAALMDELFEIMEECKLNKEAAGD